ncbi:MBL fold metallo-hydrolase [Aestuariimicrobium soli]|uniref:MBL fold metallo-hydrolase n=1 Tax=Aestuariimicrobium soli TaxID=2035834 RepID=UPI003EBF85D8
MNHHVDPGTSTSFDLGGGVTCHKLSVGPMDNNAYLLAPADGPLVLIDAANDAHRLLAEIGDRPLLSVVTTHQHHDHIKALAEVAEVTGTRAFCGSPDAEAIGRATGVDQRGLWTGDRVALGDGHLEVIGLVGHTPGSIALVWRPEGAAPSVFTGDSLFPGGVGKTSGAENFTRLLDDVTSLLFEALPDETIVHPGHGDSTTLGAERPHLKEWRARGW